MDALGCAPTGSIESVALSLAARCQNIKMLWAEMRGQLQLEQDGAVQVDQVASGQRMQAGLNNRLHRSNVLRPQVIHTHPGAGREMGRELVSRSSLRTRVRTHMTSGLRLNFAANALRLAQSRSVRHLLQRA